MGRIAGLMAVLWLAGCGGDEVAVVPTGPVSGEVTLNGQPLDAGIISLYNKSQGVGVSTSISMGKFVFEGGVPTGEYQVSIAPPQPEPAPEGSAPEPPPAGPNIPQRYRSTDSSGLTATIGADENTLKFDLQAQ